VSSSCSPKNSKNLGEVVGLGRHFKTFRLIVPEFPSITVDGGVTLSVQLRYSARFPEASRSTLINNLQGVTGYPGFLGSVSNWSSRARDRLSDFFREVFPVRSGCICQGVELVRDGAFVGGCDCRILKPARSRGREFCAGR